MHSTRLLKSTLFAFGLATGPLANAQITVIDFDTANLWTAGSGGITSYQSDHLYTSGAWSFTGGPALRNTTTDQDFVAGALGTYSWRLRDAPGTWTATYTQSISAETRFTAFGFDARRWDGDPSPQYTVEFSLNGGTSFSSATSIGTSGTLDNAAFDNSSDWNTFSQTISSIGGLAADQFIVRVTRVNGERIMIDNFSSTISPIPEPSSFAVLVGLTALAGVATRRRRS